MTYLAACSVATLLLAVFVIISIWQIVAARALHQKHLEEIEIVRRRLTEAADRARGMAHGLDELRACNLAAERLDQTMRRTIAEGLDLARVLDASNTQFETLVAARHAQREQEDSTLATWAKIRDDLEAFYASYPPYLFTGGGDG